MRPIDAGRQLLHAVRHSGAAPRHPLGKALDEAFDQARSDDRHQHEQPDDTKDREAGLEEIAERDAEHEAMLGERLPRSEPDREWTRDREEAYRRDERDEDRAERDRDGHPGALH